MAVTRLFDALFVNQLFHTDARGETVFYPNGRKARGYRVPHERAADVRSGVRRLVLFALIGVLAFVVFVPRMIEAWLGFEIPLGWFIGGAAIATVIGVAIIIHGLKRLREGLAPVREAT